MTTKHLVTEMTWPEVNEAVRQRRVVLLPVGAIEQHGPHLPVDVDNRITVSVCEEAARRAPDILAAMPPIHYGYNAHNMDFPGTISIAMTNFLN
jgi:creatinine amidohydrolase